MANPWDQFEAVTAEGSGNYDADRGVVGSGGYEDVGTPVEAVVSGGQPAESGPRVEVAGFNGRDLNGNPIPVYTADNPPPGQEFKGYGETGAPMFGPPETTAVGALGRGVIDTAALGFADEAGAGLEAAYQSLVNGENFGDRYDEAVTRNRDLADADGDQHQAFRIAGQLLGGLAIPAGLEGVGFRAGREALRAGLTMQEARAIAARAVTQRMTAVGAATGGTYGAGSGEDASERLLGAGFGAAGGAAAGALAGVAGGALADRAATRAATLRAAPLTEEQRTARAAARLGMDTLPADVGGPMTRRLTAGAAQAPLSANPIIRASQRILARGQEVRNEVASTAGQATDEATAGEAARMGAENYIHRTSNIGGGLYDRAARRAGDATIDPVEARQVLDDQIARLEAVPGGGQGLEEAQAMRDALNGRFSVQGIRDMRTEMFIDPQLRGSPMDRRMRQVIDAAGRDVENGLRAQGLDDAANAFATADRFWRDRLETIDQVIAPVIGQPGQAKGGEAITKAITTASKGDVVKLQRFLATLPNDERSTVTASFINRLGRATKGQQNDTNDAFSFSTFLSQWSELSDRARNVLFTPEQRAALQDLATVANGVRNAQRYANHSNTSGGLIAQLVFTGGAGLGGVKTLGTSLIGQYAAGSLLASPRFARWLARAPRTSLNSPAYIDRLSRIARAEPAIANEVLAIQSRLSQSLHMSPPVAAQNETQER